MGAVEQSLHTGGGGWVCATELKARDRIASDLDFIVNVIGMSWVPRGGRR